MLAGDNFYLDVSVTVYASKKMKINLASCIYCMFYNSKRNYSVLFMRTVTYEMSLLICKLESFLSVI